MNYMELDKNIFIKANPGTGKTTSLADRVIELIKNGVSEKEILCLTFTNKAVDEMFDKISLKLKENGMEGSRINGLTISTFHSFCNLYFSEQGKEYELVSNNFIRFSIFKSLENNSAFNYERDYIIQELIPKIENSIRYIKSFGITPDSINIERTKEELMNRSFLENMGGISVNEILAFLDYFMIAFRDYEREKGEKRMDYNDLLSRFIMEYDPLKKHYRYVLVDELQDLNDVEAEIARLVGDYLFLVGDRKQSIFGFQGGSLKNFIEFQKLPDLESLTKGLNYRSYGEIIEYAKEYFLRKTKDPSYKEELNEFKGNKGEGGKVTEFVGSNTDNIAVKLAIDLISQNKKAAIITRTNDQIISISRLLDSKNIKYATTASASVSKRAKNAVIDYLKGIFYRDEKDVIKAIFTPFSGVPLRKAFEIEERYRKKEIGMEEIKRLAKPLFDRMESALDVYGVNRLFNEVILPISVSLDNDYYISAAAILENINDYFDNNEIPNFNDILVYLYAAEDSYESNDQKENLILTTVHKSKGLEFDNVVYVPKKQNNKTSFIDLVTNSIIKQVKDIDVKEELLEEGIRVDFVAFTRAKESLFIAVNPALSEDYYIEGLVERVFEEIEDEPAPYKKRYEEAYSLFVNKRYEEAKELLTDNNKWLIDRVRSYFDSKLRTISFSLLDSLSDPLNFIKRDVLGIKERTKSTEFGSKAHKLAEDYFKGKINEEELNENEKKVFGNIKNIIEEINAKYNSQEIEAEKTIDMPLSAVFPEIKVDLRMTAKLDAVFLNKARNRLLIIDFKTDRSEEQGSKHRRQLALYRRMLALENKTDEKEIDTAIAYINLTGKINTGKFTYKLDTQKVKDSQIETIEKYILQLVEYINDPSKLVENAIKKYYYSDSLSDEIFKKLKEEYANHGV